LFIACGIASQAYREAGYKYTSRSLTVCSSKLLARPPIQRRILELQSQNNVKALRKDITKEALMDRMWEIVHDPDAKRGESIQAGIQIAKMAGWNAPTRVEHDLGDRVRSYLESIRAQPLRTLTAQVVETKRLE
jgi:hypothetical protein